MAPLPPNSTNRVWFDYVTGTTAQSREHTVMWRTNLGLESVDNVQSAFVDFLAAIGAGNLKNGWQVLRCRYAQAANDFSVPVALLPTLESFSGTNGTAYAENREAEEWSWQGRSFATGRRVDFSLYGINVAVPPNFRYVSGGGAPAWVAGSIAELASNQIFAQAPVTITADFPVWYSYVNVQNNSYWEEEIRRG